MLVSGIRFWENLWLRLVLRKHVEPLRKTITCRVMMSRNQGFKSKFFYLLIIWFQKNHFPLTLYFPKYRIRKISGPWSSPEEIMQWSIWSIKHSTFSKSILYYIIAIIVQIWCSLKNMSNSLLKYFCTLGFLAKGEYCYIWTEFSQNRKLLGNTRGHGL